MINLVKLFLKDQSGATAVEYGLVAAMQGLGSKLSSAFVQGTLK
jgi:Flp pilus assembly pilin Flp